MKFIHISDLHFHRNAENNAGAIAVLSYIEQEYPDHKLIVTGDIVDDGHEKQYEKALEAFQPFKERIFIAPGNHDYGAAGNFYSQERASRFDQSLSVPLEQGGTFTGDNTPVVNILDENDQKVMLIALDTNLETEHPFDFACGEVGEKQLAALDNVLSNPATAGIVKMLFFHHHPFIHNNPFMELKDARELIRLIYKRVHVVLFGHKHVSYQWENINGIPFILASDNSPGKDYAREIVIEADEISVNDVAIA